MPDVRELTLDVRELPWTYWGLTLDGRSGSFVLRLGGGFEGGAARTTWTVVEGSGTGDLAGLQGEGGYVARQGEPEVAWELRWSLA